jgi:hypothetical protein
MIANSWRTTAALAAFALVFSAGTREIFAQGGITGSRARALTRWDGGHDHGGPVRPIHPIHPVRPWWPWWGPSVVVNPYPWGWDNYLYPPNRWDAPAWDGQVRDTTPPPAPRQPREPQRPLVMEWNAAKGRAEVVHLDRWDGDGAQTTKTEEPPPPPTAETTPAPPATSSLKRWDTP